jgi:hypothetical protein
MKGMMLCQGLPEAVSRAKPGHEDGFMTALAWGSEKPKPGR